MKENPEGARVTNVKTQSKRILKVREILTQQSYEGES